MKEWFQPRRMGLSEFAFAVSARPGPGDWSVLTVTGAQRPAAVAETLSEELHAFTDVPVHLLDITDDAADVVGRFGAMPPGVVIATEIEPLSEATLQRLDFARSRLLRDDAVVLVLRLATLQALFRSAPNLASFVEGFVVTLVPEAERLSAEEKEARLADLRRRMSRTDAEVLRLARRGELPQEPSYAEWLVLLGYGGLIGSA